MNIKNVSQKKSISQIDDKLPLKTRIAYGLVSTSSSSMEGFVFGSITFFYNIKLGLSAELIGIAWIIFGIWNALNDPIFGILQEKTKTNIGRRIPYIRYGSFVFGFLFIFSWIPLFGDSQTALIWNFLVVLFCFDTIFTLVGLVNYSLPAELTFTAKSRANLIAWATILGAIGVLVAMVTPMILLTGSSREIHSAFYPSIIIIGVIASITMFIASFFLKEINYSKTEETLGFLESIKMTFKNKPFVIYEVNGFLFQIAYTIINSAIFYYVNFVLELSGLLAMIPLISVFIFLFISTGFLSTQVERFGAKKIHIASLTFSSIAFIIAFFIGDLLIPSLILMALIGIGIGGRMLTDGVIMADIIDFDETQTGKRRETTYAGINALIIKPAISIGNWLYLSIFSAYGFDKDSTTQIPSVKSGILLGFFLIPGILLLISALVVYYYPLDGKDWENQKMKIHAIHKQKEKAFLKSLQNNKEEI